MERRREVPPIQRFQGVCCVVHLQSRFRVWFWGQSGKANFIFFYIFPFFLLNKKPSTGPGSGFGAVTGPVPGSSRALKINARIRFFHSCGSGKTQTAHAGSGPDPVRADFSATSIEKYKILLIKKFLYSS